LFLLASLKSGNDFLCSHHGRNTWKSKAVSERKNKNFICFENDFPPPPTSIAKIGTSVCNQKEKQKL
jgi:hypothetical protein